jgi:hypothetical protein
MPRFRDCAVLERFGLTREHPVDEKLHEYGKQQCTLWIFPAERLRSSRGVTHREDMCINMCGLCLNLERDS